MSANNIPAGLRVPTQTPLDAKLHVASQAVLSDLGSNNNLAYTYYEGMIVYCVAERTRWEWRQEIPGEITMKLLLDDFTYPNNLVVDGVTYSNKVFNFFRTSLQGPTGPAGADGADSIMVLSTNQCINLSQALVGSFVTLNFGSAIYNLGWKIGTRVKIFADGNNYLEGIVSSVITNPVSSINVNVDLVVGSGNFCDFNIVITGTPGTPGTNGIDGLDGLDYTANNLQRTITTFGDSTYTLQPEDNNYTLIIQTGGTNKYINIPTGLPENFAVAFIQKGAGDVRIDALSGVTRNTPITDAYTIKGPNYFAYLEQEGTSNTYYLGGNIKI